MIHAKQWHYSLQQRLPVASFYTHSTRRNPRDSSSTNSTFRRQRALRVILHTEGKEIFYPVYKAFQPQDLPQAFQFYKDIPVIHDIPDIPVIHDIPAFQALLHVPAPSSTNQYLPVLSSVSKDSTCSSISSIRMQILHTDWFPPETPLSTNRIQDILQTLHSSKKGRCCDIGHTFDIFSRIEFNSSNVLSSRVTNYKNDIHKFS